MLLDGIIGWVEKHIIEEAMKYLIGLLIPSGVTQIVEGIIGIYKSIQSALKYAAKILQIVNTVLDSLIGIAQGALGPVATMLENALARGLPIVIGYLANLLDLDDIGDDIKDIVGAVRESVDSAIGWLIDKAISAGQAVLGALGIGDQQQSQPTSNKAETDIDEPLTIGEEAHTLRAHVDNGHTKILMASDKFDFLAEQVTKLRQKYESIETFKDLIPVLDAGIQEIIVKKNEIEANADKTGTQEEANKIRILGVESLKKMLEQLGEKLRLSAGRKVAVGDRVVYIEKSGERRGAIVTEIGVMIQVGTHEQAGIKIETPVYKPLNFLWVSYESYGKAWEITKVPLYIPFDIQGDVRIVTIDAEHLRDDEGGRPGIDPPGYSPKGPWKERGHLVPGMFQGPGNSSNIVAILSEANRGKDVMSGIENTVRDDVKKGAVYEYKARPVYNSEQQEPPIAIEIVADRLYPEHHLEARSVLNTPTNPPNKEKSEV